MVILKSFVLKYPLRLAVLSLLGFQRSPHRAERRDLLFSWLRRPIARLRSS